MNEVGRRFLFLINKIENNTIHITQILQNRTVSEAGTAPNGLENSLSCGSSDGLPPALASNTSSIQDTFANTYDSSGAARYIVVVVLVYGFAIIFFIGSQVRSTKKFSDDVDDVNAEKILRSMETEIFTKEVLAKLSDKDHRERAWKIYLGKPTNSTGASPNQSRRNSTASVNQAGGKKAIYNDESLKKIDKSAVSSIEKRLKILNKTQSSRYSRDPEVEVVKETSKSKSKSKKTNGSKYSNFFRDSFISKNLSQNQQTSGAKPPPLIVLQTDDEGLHELRQPKRVKTKDDDGKSRSRSRSRSGSRSNLGADEGKNKELSASPFISFDVCEISEKITTV